MFILCQLAVWSTAANPSCLWAAMGGATHPKQVASQYDNPHSHLETEPHRVARRPDVHVFGQWEEPEYMQNTTLSRHQEVNQQPCRLKPCASLGKKTLTFNDLKIMNIL